MMSLNIQTNVNKFVRDLDHIQRNQVPFATATALTWTVKEAQKQLQEQMPKTFNTTRKWWMARQPTGIKIKSAKKKDLYPEAVVYIEAYFAQLQEEGGAKIPFKGRGILVPSDRVPKYGRKAGGSKKVMAQKKILRCGGKATGDPIVTMPNGKRGVFKRRTKKRLPIDLIYSYVPQAQIRPRMMFKGRAAHIAIKRFDDLFAKSLAMALKTAR
jgi:hypothetical protein